MSEFKSAFNSGTTVVVAEDNIGRIYLKIRHGGSLMGSITLGSESVIPLARAVLDAAGVDAEVVTLPDVRQGSETRWHEFTVNGGTYTVDHDESPAEVRAYGLAHLAIARHLESRPDPQVEKLAAACKRAAKLSLAEGITDCVAADFAKALRRAFSERSQS